MSDSNAPVTGSRIDESESTVERIFGNIDWLFGLIALAVVIGLAYVAVTTTLDYRQANLLEEKYDAKISHISETTPHEVIVGNVEMKCLVDSGDDTVLLCRPLDGDTYAEPPVVG